MVRRASSTVCATGSSCAPSTTKSDRAWASGTAWPSANETCAPASTGASFRPSPTMATLWPWACKARSACSLSSGEQPPRASAIPSACATRFTARWPSPESTCTPRPAALSASTQACASLRSASASEKVAIQPCASHSITSVSASAAPGKPQNAAEPRRKSRVSPPVPLMEPLASTSVAAPGGVSLSCGCNWPLRP